MIYTLSNEDDCLFEEGKVRLTIDTDPDKALEILAAAREIHDRPDPVLEALRARLEHGVITQEMARNTMLPPQIL